MRFGGDMQLMMVGTDKKIPPNKFKRLPGETLAAFTFIGGCVKLVASVVEERKFLS